MDVANEGNSWGGRLRARGRELGLTDAEVARRLGLTQGRYSSYVNQTREPDFQTFVRICRTLSTRPDIILGFSGAVEAGPKSERDMARAVGVLATLDAGTLGLATALLEVLAERTAAGELSDRSMPALEEAAGASRHPAKPGKRAAAARPGSRGKVTPQE